MITINSVAVRAPQRFEVSVIDHRATDITAAGTTVIDRVATKRVLRMEWGALTNAQASAILGATANVFFTVVYPDPQTGTSETITCYVNDKSAPMARYKAGAILWEGLTMELVEQ